MINRLNLMAANPHEPHRNATAVDLNVHADPPSTSTVRIQQVWNVCRQSASRQSRADYIELPCPIVEVSHRLNRATAATAKIWTRRRHTIEGRSQNLQQAATVAAHFGADGFAG